MWSRSCSRTAGWRVVAVASGESRGRALLADAERAGAGARAAFVRADLSTLAGMREVVAEVEATADAVDGLVFGAQRFRPRREETEDGLEFTFALAGTCSGTGSRSGWTGRRRPRS
ncbi:SDR family NAD(P)-dependent oxidoreductase [Actinomadura sp. LOL_016]|uniref:SDR family NAD(P)-dependent oxidoreductase n=1 Tax=unclassified Actinomadura TaxID=2626254 RepID=UPI003A802EC1